MTTETLTPAQERMAAARAARKKRPEPVPVLPDDVVARAKAQRDAADAELRKQSEREAVAEAQRVAREHGQTPRPDANGPTSLQRGAQREEAAAQAREEAARAAIAPRAGPEMVRVRVTKQGDGKVSTGQHAAGIGEVHYAWREEFEVARPVAQALEDRYLVEIV
jgi:hypothetical protein